MLKPLLAALIFLTSAAPAHADQPSMALGTAAADTATTAMGLSSGLVELNPLGPIGAIVVKAVTMSYISQQPAEDRPQQYSVVSSIWGGAAASNLCWLTGAGPLCFLVGLITGNQIWRSGEDERNYWTLCKSARRTNPAMSCDWKPGDLLPHEEKALARND